MIDCLIVGGGPAGLTAAIYAARFHLSVCVVDGGRSRAAQIPCTRNHAGFPDGVSGPDLLARMREQAELYGVQIIEAQIAQLRRDAEGFTAASDAVQVTARAVVLATGVTNRRPPMDEETHARALQQGRLRYCPVCDGYEVTDQVVAVLGRGPRAAREAEFLRSYSPHVSFVALDADDGLDVAERDRLDKIGVVRISGPVTAIDIAADGLRLSCGGERHRFDAVYPSLGSDVHSDLARQLGAAVADDGCIKVDAHQRTSVPGLYAAGDVVIGLDQISHAMGEAGVAATTLRNDLAHAAPLLR